MLELKNNNLRIKEREIIISPDSKLSLLTTVTDSLFGELELSNGVKKIYQFIKTSETTEGIIYNTMLLLEEHQIPYVEHSKFKVKILTTTEEYTTNEVYLDFDIQAIKQKVQKIYFNDINTLTKKLNQLEQRLNSITSNSKLVGINLANKTCLAKGMVPVALDSKGNFIAQYLYPDYIRNINGQSSLNGVVQLDSSMIQYNKKNNSSLEDIIKSLFEIEKKIQESINLINTRLEDIQKNLSEVELNLDKHLDNNII